MPFGVTYRLVGRFPGPIPIPPLGLNGSTREQIRERSSCGVDLTTDLTGDPASRWQNQPALLAAEKIPDQSIQAVDYGERLKQLG